MNNLEKMNELVSSSATKRQVKDWAYINRILLSELEYEEEFEVMKISIQKFMKSELYTGTLDELKIWDSFLDAEYVGQV